MENSKEFWNNVYAEKTCTEVSWYEPMPEVSLDYISHFDLPKDAAIIDVGGGDSFLGEFLVAEDYENVTVLDISETVIERAKERLAERAEEINWMLADVLEFIPPQQYDLWHDRAVFHFFKDEMQQKKYLEILKKSVKPGGYVIIATFSEKGPEKCSGLPVNRYSIGDLQKLFSDGFTSLNCKNKDHSTPTGKVQNFTFCSFKKD